MLDIIFTSHCNTFNTYRMHFFLYACNHFNGAPNVRAICFNGISLCIPAMAVLLASDSIRKITLNDHFIAYNHCSAKTHNTILLPSNHNFLYMVVRLCIHDVVCTGAYF